jgi:Helix-turn-helix
VATCAPLCFIVWTAPSGQPSAKRVPADNLRLARLMRRLSQTVLAEEAGVTQALVSAIERGRANPTVEKPGTPGGGARRPAGRAVRGERTAGVICS